MTRIGVAAVLALAAWGARADDVETFGRRGRVLFTGAVALQNVSSDAPASKAVTTFELSPGGAIFLGQNVAVGGRVRLRIAAGGTDLVSIGLLPSIGYNFDVAAGVSWLPQLQVGPSNSRRNSITVTRWSAGAYAPLLIRPKGNLFVGVGPDFLVDLGATASTGEAARETAFGVLALLGGWF
jgi:hypothetical protein